MTGHALTGRTRYRSQRRWGREELILQVEERWVETYSLGGYIDTNDHVGWRDARTSDLTSKVIE